MRLSSKLSNCHRVYFMIIIFIVQQYCINFGILIFIFLVPIIIRLNEKPFKCITKTGKLMQQTNKQHKNKMCSSHHDNGHVCIPRCQDETENETYISAIRCTKCPGYFLPENPIGDSRYDHGSVGDGDDVRLGRGGGW